MTPFAIPNMTLPPVGSDPAPGRLCTWKGIMDDPGPMIMMSVSKENIIILYPEGDVWQHSTSTFLSVVTPMIFPDAGGT